MSHRLAQRLAAEAIGTAFLVAAIVGSGVMAERLTDDAALALLANAIATGAALVVLISVFAPISGAHLNPAVTLAALLARQLPLAEAVGYAAVQIAGGVSGTILAHAMFGEPLLQLATQPRDGVPLAFSEVIAAFGLLTLILFETRRQSARLPLLVGLYITAAYWFTASTSFANPAVTVARSVTDTFSGIAPASVLAFIAAQLAGTLLAWAFERWMNGPSRSIDQSPNIG